MIIQIKKLLPVLVMVCLFLALFPFSADNAQDITAVYIGAPANMPAGSSFTARVNVAEVSNLSAYQFQLNYDPDIIQVIGAEGGSSGVTSGLIGTTFVAVDKWCYVPPGSPGGVVRVVGRFPDGRGVSGSGYLAEIHFQVVGTVGQSSAITPTDTATFKNGLFDSQGEKISTMSVWSGSSIEVSPALEMITSALPQCAVGGYYATNLEASGGLPFYTWNASGLPAGLAISPEGIISGVPSSRTITQKETYFNIHVKVNDTVNTQIEKDLPLRLIWKAGDANGDGEVNMGDIIKLERILQHLDAATPGADANQDGSIDIKDIIEIEKIYLGLVDSPQ